MSQPRVLFVNSDRIGDCVMFSGMVREALRQVPGARITIACGPTAAPLFRTAPSLERVIALPKKKGGGHWLDLYRATAGRRWDLVADIRGSPIAWLLRAREKRVYSRRWETGLHKVEMASRLMRAPEISPPELFLDDRARAEAARVLEAAGGAPVLAFAPVSTDPLRSWPAERWGALIARLKAESRFDGWRFMAVGGPDDHAAAAPALAAAGARGMDAVGKGDILASAAMIDDSTLFVGNDSGLMHVAAAAGRPTLGLFGPSEWWHKAPYGPTGRIVASSPTRGAFRPIETLTVDRVLEAVIALHDEFGRAAAP